MESARKLIALDKPKAKPSNPEAMLMACYYQVWQKGADGNLHLNRRPVLRGWELANSSAEHANMRKWFTPYVFLGSLQDLPKGQVNSAFETCVSGNRMPRHADQKERHELCELAFRRYSKLHPTTYCNPPAEWAKLWERDWEETQCISGKAPK